LSNKFSINFHRNWIRFLRRSSYFRHFFLTIYGTYIQWPWKDMWFYIFEK